MYRFPYALEDTHLYHKSIGSKQKLYDEWKIKRDAKAVTVEVTPRIISDPETERRREENRRKFPEFAAFYDEVRKHFPGAYVTSIRMKKDLSPASHVSDVLDAQDDQQ